MNRNSPRRWLTATVCAVLCVALFMPGAALAESMKATPESSVAPYDAALPQELKGDNLYASGAVLIDGASGVQLFSKNADKKLFPASTTKVLTCLLALELGSLDDIVTCTSEVTKTEASWIELRKGEEIPLKDLLYAMMLHSANDAAIAVAIHIGDSLSEFATMMNNRAMDLGCTDSNFVNPNGMPNDNHYSTASDMAKIVRAAMQREDFRNIIATLEYTISKTNKSDARTIKTKDAFLYNSGDSSYSYEYGIGVKTGYTNASKHSFVGAANKDGVELYSVVLGSTKEGKWTDTIKMMDYGFSRFVSFDLMALYNLQPKIVNILNADLEYNTDAGTLPLELKTTDGQSLSAIMVLQEDLNNIETNYNSYVTITEVENKEAPIMAGQVMGEFVFQYGDMAPITAQLVAARSVTARLPQASTPPSVDDIQSSAEKKSETNLWWLLLLVPAGLIVFFAVGLGLEYRRRKMRARSRYASGYGRGVARRYR